MMKTTRVGVQLFICAWAIGACTPPAKRGDVETKEVPAAGGASAVAVEENPPNWCQGLPVEIVETRNEDGTLALRQSVVKDKEGNAVPHGPLVRFWETGEKKLELNYDCGVKHGKRTSWHTNGKEWSVGEFVNGLDHGVWTEWTAEGNKIQEFTMDHGVWQGVHTQWHPNGSKRREVRYVDGLIQGPLTFWDDGGAVLATIDFVDGKEQPTPKQR